MLPGSENRDDEWAVCVYCASSPRHPELLDLARRVGEAIADRGWTLVSGGGNVSAMGSVAEGARSHGGRTVGVISHVEAMKEQVPAQILVEATPEGPSVIRQDAAVRS